MCVSVKPIKSKPAGGQTIKTQRGKIRILQITLKLFKNQQKFRTTIFVTVQDIIFLRYAHYEHHHKLREGFENTFLRAQITIGDMFMLTCQVKFTLNFKS